MANEEYAKKVGGSENGQMCLELTDNKNLIVKNNVLVQKSSYQLTSTEQKIVLSMIQQIRPTDETLKPIALTISNYCRLTGITTSGKNYKNIRENIKSLADKSAWIPYTNEKGEQMYNLLRWIEDPVINESTGEIYLKLSDKLEPLLLNQTENFTQYNIQSVIAMNSFYSMRLYEYIKSNEFKIVKGGKGKFKVPLLLLRKILTDAKKAKNNQYMYPVFADFRRKVMDIAIREINQYTELKVSVDYAKTGRQVTDVIFTVERKTKPNEVIAVPRNITKKLNKQSFEDYNQMYARQVSEEEYNAAKRISPFAKSTKETYSQIEYK